MKKVEAVIRPEKLDEVREALDAHGFSGITATEVKGRGKQKGVLLEWRVGEYRVEFLPKVKLEMIVEDKHVNTVVETIESICTTGQIGDGKIFISPVEQVIRLSTKESGVVAI